MELCGFCFHTPSLMKVARACDSQGTGLSESFIFLSESAKGEFQTLSVKEDWNCSCLQICSTFLYVFLYTFTFFTKLALNNLINRTDWNVYIYISLYTEQSASFQRGENLCSTLPTWCRKWWKWTEAMPLLGLSWKKARCSKSQKAWLCSMYAYSPDISWHLSYGLNMAKHG